MSLPHNSPKRKNCLEPTSREGDKEKLEPNTNDEKYTYVALLSLKEASERQTSLKTRNKSSSDENMTPIQEGKQYERLLRNRLAARECRKRKKQYVKELERRVKILEELNKRLRMTLGWRPSVSSGSRSV